MYLKQSDMKPLKPFFLLSITTIIIISFISGFACESTTPTLKEVKNVFSTQIPISTEFKVQTATMPSKVTVPSATASFSTKEKARTTKTYTVTESPNVSHNFTTDAYTSTKGHKSAWRQKLNTSSSALGNGVHSPARLQDRLGAIDCDLPAMPREARLWRGNETHELNLPVTDCEGAHDGGAAVGAAGAECPPIVVSWEGSAEIQSGDILIVRIGDSTLLDTFGHVDGNNSTLDANTSHDESHRSHALFQPAVYQVNRQGHEHCDISDGTLLDITPLDERGAKLFTLYDKDLADGVNLLIVVSESWGSQCVRLKVTVKLDNCGEAQDCSGRGVCYTNASMEGYECQCCAGYIGSHCEERAVCDPSPCLNNGICNINLAKPFMGVSYTCICPSGFTGIKCEKDPCYSAPCLNGGSCMSMTMNGATVFHCACAEAWTGARCEFPSTGGACASKPCVKGICVEQTDSDEDGPDYRCFCEPGFTGEKCELEYNECESSPCGNGGTCTDRVGGFDCACARGYTGTTCQLKVDLCSPDPCPSQRYCVDHGNSYSCNCPRGYVGDECHIPATSACDNNPCAHGGTCWSGVDSFYCSCRPGYTGKLCEEDFILESVVDGEGDVSEEHAGSSVREMRLPMGLYHDRLHNVYIAAGTLGAAIVIVGVVVTACHCRENKTYSRLLSRLSRVRESGPPRHWLQEKRSPTPAPPPPAPLDTTDMYYTLDFSDSQSSPLIQ